MAKNLNRRAPRLRSWSFIFQHFYQRPVFFIETSTLRNYADDNTMNSSDKNYNIVISRLRHDFAIRAE